MDHARLARTARGFDRLAGVYDGLVRLVYGRSLRRAQFHWLDELESADSILILGGGTGWLLEEVLRRHERAQVIYVELSPAMIARSQARIQAHLPDALDRIQWTEGTIRDVPEDIRCDAVCTMFFLDLFEGEHLTAELAVIDRHLHPEAAWLLTDFTPTERGAMRVFSRLLIWTMYRFFRWICRIPAGRLGDFVPALQQLNFSVTHSQRFHRGMIISHLLRRS